MNTAPERIEIAPASAGQQQKWKRNFGVRLGAVPVVTFKAMLEAAASAAEHKLAFSFIRVGDRTMAMIEYPRTVFGDPNVDSSPAYPAGWHLSAQTIRQFKPRFRKALAAADVVGIITWNDPQYAQRVRSVWRLLDGVPRAVTTSLSMRHVEGHIEHIRGVVAGRRVFCIGMEARKWSKALQRLGAAKVFVWPYDGVPSITIWPQYSNIVRWISASIKPGDVAMIAIGPWSRVLGHDVQRLGAVGLDLGSGLRKLPGLVP